MPQVFVLVMKPIEKRVQSYDLNLELDNKTFQRMLTKDELKFPFKNKSTGSFVQNTDCIPKISTQLDNVSDTIFNNVS